MRRICMLAVVAVFAASSLLAADLGRFQDWDESPEGYFMTKAEREQWAQVTSEGDAAKFVEAFLAKRDAGFPAEVKLRAEQADKYLTIGKVKVKTQQALLQSMLEAEKPIYLDFAQAFRTARELA